MLNNKKVVAVIPAKGKSRGVPYKNIKLFNQMPLITWTIKAALQSKLIDEVYVNSDDDDILNLALSYENIKTFKRTASLATDNSLIFDTLKHFSSKVNSDLLVMLNPTSPIRTGEFIDSIINQYTDDDDLIATCKESLEFECGTRIMANRQDMKPFAYDTGSVYVFDTEYIKCGNDFYPHKNFIKTIITDQIYNYEIDTQVDFEICELLHKKYILEEKCKANIT
jgi:N-acylneuraminate cytidylyltransferase